MSFLNILLKRQQFGNRFRALNATLGTTFGQAALTQQFSYRKQTQKILLDTAVLSACQTHRPGGGRYCWGDVSVFPPSRLSWSCRRGRLCSLAKRCLVRQLANLASRREVPLYRPKSSDPPFLLDATIGVVDVAPPTTKPECKLATRSPGPVYWGDPLVSLFPVVVFLLCTIECSRHASVRAKCGVAGDILFLPGLF